MTGVGWLDEAEQRAAKATPGPWKLWSMQVLADLDGTGNVDTAVPVADTFYRDDHWLPRTFDADFIASARTDFPRAVAALRAVLDLHPPNRDYGSVWCFGCDRPWPCPTVAAINGAAS